MEDAVGCGGVELIGKGCGLVVPLEGTPAGDDLLQAGCVMMVKVGGTAVATGLEASLFLIAASAHGFIDVVCLLFA